VGRLGDSQRRDERGDEQKRGAKTGAMHALM
jgi:hypothetical protein